MSESGSVAAVMYIIHMTVLSVLVVLGIVYACNNTEQFVANMKVNLFCV